MARFDFDFHAAPARPPLAGLALALAGAVLLAWSVHAWQTARDKEAGLALQIAALEKARPAAARAAPPADLAAQQTRARIAAQLAWRWQPAFDALAAAQDKTVALVALDASHAKAQLKLTAEARVLEDALAWIERLQQQPGIKRVTLVQHEIQVDVDQQPVRFVVNVELGA